MAARDARFRREQRLRRSQDFQRVSARGRRAASAALVCVVALRRPDEPARLGLTVSRRVGSAVVRNRVKRAVREWFRRARLAPGIDLVVIARNAVATLPARAIASQLDDLVAPLAAAARRWSSRDHP
jgi:ribonuclease P protein component